MYVHIDWAAFQREEPSESLKDEGLWWPQFQRGLLVKEIWISDWLKHFKKEPTTALQASCMMDRNSNMSVHFLQWGLYLTQFKSTQQSSGSGGWDHSSHWARPWSDMALDVLGKSHHPRGTRSTSQRRWGYSLTLFCKERWDWGVTFELPYSSQRCRN